MAIPLRMARGTTAIGSLSAGTYSVRVTSETGYVAELHDNLPCIASDCPTTAGTPVVLADGGSATINFALAPEGRIAGTVSRTGSGALAGASVSIYNASTSLVKSVTTDAAGAYVANGLAAGNYFVRVGNELYNDKPCLLSCMIAAGTPVAVTAGATTSGIDIALPRGGSISGTVVAEGSLTPLANVPVSVFHGELEVGRRDHECEWSVHGRLPVGGYLPPAPRRRGQSFHHSGSGRGRGCHRDHAVASQHGRDFRPRQPAVLSQAAGLIWRTPQVEIYTSTGTSVGLAVNDPAFVATGRRGLSDLQFLAVRAAGRSVLSGRPRYSGRSVQPIFCVNG